MKTGLKDIKVLVLNNTHHCNCVLIGEDLKSTKDYHLLVDRNGVKIDRDMSKEEKILIDQILKAVGVLK